MKIRCDVNLNGHSEKVILVARPEEKADHLALKLAAYALFLGRATHRRHLLRSSRFGLDGIFVPIFAQGLNEAGRRSACGSNAAEVSINKLDKVAKRFPYARIVVLKEKRIPSRALARAGFPEVVRNSGAYRNLVLASREPSLRWLNALQEKTELFGETEERSLNLVINDVAYARIMERESLTSANFIKVGPPCFTMGRLGRGMNGIPFYCIQEVCLCLCSNYHYHPNGG